MKTVRSLLAGLLLLLFAAAPQVNAQPDEGAFSTYLVGTFENRLGVGTMIQVVNPTNVEGLQVVIAFFDVNGAFLDCLKDSVRPNGMWEVIVPLSVPKLSKDHGVVKIISYKYDEKQQPYPVHGIVGYQAKVTLIPGQASIKSMGESVLASVPTNYAEEELVTILAMCE